MKQCLKRAKSSKAQRFERLGRCKYSLTVRKKRQEFLNKNKNKGKSEIQKEVKTSYV
ncbi:MAG: hypothetical protein ACJAXS_002864 [Colwellia sp.]|jgi:hypothetical protein